MRYRNKIATNAFTKYFINAKSKLKARIKTIKIQVSREAERHATGTNFSLNLIFEKVP
ncbi:MAG: hypothetical protein U5L72_13445 [Bacteroidales bacterium]|nr:hypothetical protein [Bacteroidales bacterium]